MIPPYIKIICFLFHPLGMVIRYQRNVYEFFTLCLRIVKKYIGAFQKKKSPEFLRDFCLLLAQFFSQPENLRRDFRLALFYQSAVQPGSNEHPNDADHT